MSLFSGERCVVERKYNGKMISEISEDSKKWTERRRKGRNFARYSVLLLTLFTYMKNCGSVEGQTLKGA
jgi:hypothetical protein